MKSMREELLGYLLDALEADEREAVERRLKDDSELQRELEALHEELEPLQCDDGHCDPPPDLAARTCQLVAGHRGGPLPAAQHLSGQEALSGSTASSSSMGPVALSPAARFEGHGSNWSLADLTVAAGIFVAAALLLVPALQHSRVSARLAACQNNLRQLGFALSNYSQANDQFLPPIPTVGNRSVAGNYAVTLKENEFIDSDRRVICPASALAGHAGEIYIPTPEEIDSARGDLLAHLQRMMGGSFGYTLGYLGPGGHENIRNSGRSRFAVMADAPCLERADAASDNHGGSYGQNVLYEDGHVDFLSRSSARGCDDHIFLNDSGLRAAGNHENDAVIGHSAARPLPWPQPQ